MVEFSKLEMSERLSISIIIPSPTCTTGAFVFFVDLFDLGRAALETAECRIEMVMVWLGAVSDALRVAFEGAIGVASVRLVPAEGCDSLVGEGVMELLLVSSWEYFSDRLFLTKYND